MIVDRNVLNGLKRNSLDIERDILEYLIFNPAGEKGTNLLFKCNLAHRQALVYLNKLKDNELIQNMNLSVKGISSTWKITKKGIDRYIKIRLLEVSLK